MLPALVLAFIVVPIAELAVILAIGHSIGFLPTLLLVAAFSLAGARLLTPGFLTDVAGVLLLLPPVRAAVRRATPRLAAWRLRRAGGRRGGARTRVRVQVVDGVAYPPGSRTPGSPPAGPPGTSASWGGLELDERSPSGPLS